MKVAKSNYWWKNIVIYEMYVEKFGGTFSGAAERLDYLVSLGVDCIHLLPHYPSPMIDDGYDVTDYMAVREDLGTLKDFRDFLNRAHKLGMKVIIDFVLNHTSTQHPWFAEARGSKDSDKREYYLWSSMGKELLQAPNLFPDLKSSNWIYNKTTNDYYFSTFHQEQADLNWNNPKVFSEMAKVMDFWVALGVDGFRLDAASHLVKKEGTSSDGLPETHKIIKRIRRYLDRRSPGIILLAEVCESVENTKKYFGRGDECHLVYNFPLVPEIMLALKNGDSGRVRRFASKLALIPKSCDWANFLGHHDEMSLSVAAPARQEELFDYYDPEKRHRFGHGISLRTATMLGQNKEKMLEAFQLLFSVPGSSIIYYGDEIGMENEAIPFSEKDTRKSLRAEFPWEIAKQQAQNPESLLSGVATMAKSRHIIYPTVIGSITELLARRRMMLGELVKFPLVKINSIVRKF
jgi:maltose alpha-D-glucosyltransferase/alpha-amylase